MDGGCDQGDLHYGSGILTIRSDCIVRSTSVMLQGMQERTESGGSSYAALTFHELDEDLVEESSAVSIVAAACLLVLLIVCVSLGWYYFHQCRVRAVPVEEPQTTREVRSNDQPLLEKPIGEFPI
ncbi:Hypothetical predicted protein [Drosophila guanche]|uniref:Uncharacterized protein n=1 Tax=Drosophila guanche TaxID=7266 RepID=A0A3B0JCY0_DROGU|nr:Hypothetical predicted protein [Drosophila guanche]